MNKTVLVTGATGLLGRQVLSHFVKQGWDAVGTSLTRPSPPTIVQLDVTDKDAVKKLLDVVRPTVVVHCAADRSPDSCNARPDAARALNATAAGDLASLTYEQGAFLIYISTDYVFPGRPGEAPYKSTSIPNPTNVYGQTKLEGEYAVLSRSCLSDKKTESGISRSTSAVILRVPILYGPLSDNDPSQSAINVLIPQIWASQSKTQEEAAKKTKIKMDDYAQRFPTNTEDVARVCFDIANLYPSEVGGNDLPAILQFSSEEKFTKFQMCQLLAEILGLPLDGIEPDRSAEMGTGDVQRPYDCHLDTTVLRELGIDVSAIRFETWWRRNLRAFRH